MAATGEDERVEREARARFHDRVVSSLMAIPVLNDRQMRILLQELVSERMGRRVAVREHGMLQAAYLELVRACAATEGGLACVADAVRSVASDAVGVDLLVELCAEWSRWEREGARRAVPAGAGQVPRPLRSAIEQLPTERAFLERVEPTGLGLVAGPTPVPTAQPAVLAAPPPFPVPSRERRDFFLSYTRTDRSWAAWIAWELEAAGYRVLVQAWDFTAGSNWYHEMHEALLRCDRTIALLSPEYLRSAYGRQEWQAAQREDPSGIAGKLVPIRVEPCEQPGLLAGVISFDLFGLDESAARAVLLTQIQALRRGRAKPSIRPDFPGPPAVAG